MDDTLKANITSERQWLRLLYIVFFIACCYLALTLTWVIVPAQFLFVLISGERNLSLNRFADVLCQYMRQVFDYLCFVSDEKPFPFADFPEPRVEGFVELRPDANTGSADKVTQPSTQSDSEQDPIYSGLGLSEDHEGAETEGDKPDTNKQDSEAEPNKPA